MDAPYFFEGKANFVSFYSSSNDESYVTDVNISQKKN